MGIGENQSQVKTLRVKVQHLSFKLTQNEVDWTEWEKKFIQSINGQNVDRLSSKQIEWINRLLRKRPRNKTNELKEKPANKKTKPTPSSTQKRLSNFDYMIKVREQKKEFHSKLWVGKNRKPLTPKPDLDEMG